MNPFPFGNSPADAAAMICAADVSSHLESGGHCAKPLKERVELAFKQARKFWMTTEDDPRFRGALAGVMTADGCSKEDKDILISSMNSVQKLNAMLTAGRAGLAVELSEDDMPKDTDLPLLGMWHESSEK
jgi:hypothetical protein